MAMKQMKTRSYSNMSVAVFAALCSIGSAVAAPGDPLGPQYSLATDLMQQQVLPVVAMTPSGQNLIVYIEQGTTGTAVRGLSSYAPTALPQPQAFTVAQSSNTLNWPAVGASKYGRALVAWQEMSSTGAPQAIYAQPYLGYDATVPSGPALHVGSAAEPYYPSVAANWYGTRFAVAWVQKESDGRYGVHIQRYDYSALPVGAEQRVDTSGMGIFQPISLAMSDGTRHIVAWCGNLALGNFRNGIFVQRYDDTTPVGTPQLVMGWPTGSYVQRPAVAMAGDGSFIVAWEQGFAIRAQRFDADGHALDVVQQISSLGTGIAKRSNPNIGVDRNHDYVIAWDAADGSSYHIMARRYAADGTARGAEFAVNDSANGQLVLPRVGIDADGDTLVTWTSPGTAGGAMRAYARRLQGDGDVDLALGASVSQANFGGGNAVDFQLAVSNHNGYPDQNHEGAGSATGIAVNITPSADSTLLGIDGTGWQCDAGSAPWHCRYSKLLMPGSAATALTLHVSSAANVVGVQATVAGDQADSLGNNNTADASVTR